MDVHKIGRKEGRQADKISLLARCPDSLAPCAPAELKSERWQLLTTDTPPQLATLAQWELWHRERKTRPHRHLCSPGTGLPLLRRSLISGHKLAVRSAMFSARPPSSKLCPFGGCTLSVLDAETSLGKQRCSHWTSALSTNMLGASAENRMFITGDKGQSEIWSCCSHPSQNTGLGGRLSFLPCLLCWAHRYTSDFLKIEPGDSECSSWLALGDPQTSPQPKSRTPSCGGGGGVVLDPDLSF